MLRGNFTYSVDSKGRLSIPAKLRKNVNPEAENTFVITKGSEKCIEVFPLDEWKTFEKKLHKLNPHDPKQGWVKRRYLRFVHEDQLDAQNRILIPKPLMDFADIEKEVLIIGALNKLELWNPELFDKYMDTNEDNREELFAEVMKNIDE